MAQTDDDGTSMTYVEGEMDDVEGYFRLGVKEAFRVGRAVVDGIDLPFFAGWFYPDEILHQNVQTIPVVEDRCQDKHGSGGFVGLRVFLTLDRRILYHPCDRETWAVGSYGRAGT